MIQIANVVTVQGAEHPIVKNVFTLNTCAHIVGAEVLEHSRETDLLCAWRDFFVKVVHSNAFFSGCVLTLELQADPDIVTGWNIQNFDFPYLLDRAKTLQLPGFPYLGRLKNTKTTMKVDELSRRCAQFLSSWHETGRHLLFQGVRNAHRQGHHDRRPHHV